MHAIAPALMLVLLLGLTPAAASAAESDPQPNLTDLLAMGTQENIVRAARDVVDRGVRDPAVLDALAEYVLQGYALSHPEPAESVAWGCKALGAIGAARYRPVIEAAARHSGSAKVRRHCGEALRQARRARAEVLGIPAAPYAAGEARTAIGGSPVELLYRADTLGQRPQQIREQTAALVSNDESRILATIKQVHATRGSFPEVNDVLAELIEEYHRGASAMSADTVAWACKALGATGNARYQNLLYSAAKQGRRVSRGVYRHCKTGSALVRGPRSAEHYTPGSVDLAALRSASGESSAGAPAAGQAD